MCKIGIKIPGKMCNQTFILLFIEMGTYVEIDGRLYVTKEEYLNTVKYYENSLSAERDGAKEEIEELRKEIKELKAKINKVIELFNEGDSSDLYDYIDDLDYYEAEVELEDMGII